jgi:nicotinamide-nucleotide amidase
MIETAIEQEVVSLLKERKLVLTTAESCTGGMIASMIVNVAGASSVFKEGYVTYSNEAKNKMLKVSKKTLKQFSAVSKETAREMATGGVHRSGADLCVAVTGVAGPDTEDGKPVGLVYISCFYKNKIVVKECNFKGDRQQIRTQAAQRALSLVKAVLVRES